MESSGVRDLFVSKRWLQVAAVVMIFGFFVLGLLAYRTYTRRSADPDRVVDPAGQTAVHGR